MTKKRLDELLVERGEARDLHHALGLVLSGSVDVGGHRIDKAGSMIPINAEITVRVGIPYVSRGGLKLEGALDQFDLDVRNRVCVDLGSSTGGFTDCLLQKGAQRVYAFDVGRGLLHWRLQNDERVVLREKFNVRFLTPADVGEPVHLITVDLSFISLKLVLPVLGPFESLVVALAKPQFEARPEEVPAGGIIRDEALRLEILDRVRSFAFEAGFACRKETPSPVLGQKGNQEYFLMLDPLPNRS